MRSWIVALAGVALLCFAPGVRAQTKTLDSERSVSVIQQRTFVKSIRFELEPTFNLPLNETMTRHIGAGVQARLHITEEWAVGLDYIHYFGKMSSLAAGIGTDYQVYPEKRLMDFFAGAHVAYTPLFGKFLLFGGPIVNWDLFLVAGGGVTRTTGPAYRPSGDIGFGVRFVLYKFIALNLEVRDYMYMEKYRAGSKFVNNVVFSPGIGLFAPFSHDYKYGK